LGLQKYKTIVRQKTLEQSIGKFKTMYEEIMGTKVIELDEQEFAELQVDHDTIEVHRINTPTRSQYESFRQYIFSLYGIPSESLNWIPSESLNWIQSESLNWIPCDSPVVLIRRGKRRQLLDDPALIAKNDTLYSATTGAERREIRCIDQLETFLQEVYGRETVGSVELEEMAFSEQVRLFSQARIVIGIHGAGLANVVFCRPGSVLIEVDPEWNYDWQFLNHFCSSCGITRICCPNSLESIQECIRKLDRS